MFLSYFLFSLSGGVRIPCVLAVDPRWGCARSCSKTTMLRPKGSEGRKGGREGWELTKFHKYQLAPAVVRSVVQYSTVQYNLACRIVRKRQPVPVAYLRQKGFIISLHNHSAPTDRSEYQIGHLVPFPRVIASPTLGLPKTIDIIPAGTSVSSGVTSICEWCMETSGCSRTTMAVGECIVVSPKRCVGRRGHRATPIDRSLHAHTVRGRENLEETRARARARDKTLSSCERAHKGQKKIYKRRRPR